MRVRGSAVAWVMIASVVATVTTSSQPAAAQGCPESGPLFGVLNESAFYPIPDSFGTRVLPVGSTYHAAGGPWLGGGVADADETAWFWFGEADDPPVQLPRTTCTDEYGIERWLFPAWSSSHTYSKPGVHSYAPLLLCRDGAAPYLEETGTYWVSQCWTGFGNWFVVVDTPDSDGDGWVDDNDECPTTPGAPQSSGCPGDGDVDGDGIADGDDACPTVWGFASSAGCPPSSTTTTTTSSTSTTTSSSTTSTSSTTTTTTAPLAIRASSADPSIFTGTVGDAYRLCDGGNLLEVASSADLWFGIKATQDATMDRHAAPVGAVTSAGWLTPGGTATWKGPCFDREGQLVRVHLDLNNNRVLAANALDFFIETISGGTVDPGKMIAAFEKWSSLSARMPNLYLAVQVLSRPQTALTLGEVQFHLARFISDPTQWQAFGDLLASTGAAIPYIGPWVSMLNDIATALQGSAWALFTAVLFIATHPLNESLAYLRQVAAFAEADARRFDTDERIYNLNAEERTRALSAANRNVTDLDSEAKRLTVEIDQLLGGFGGSCFGAPQPGTCFSKQIELTARRRDTVLKLTAERARVGFISAQLTQVRQLAAQSRASASRMRIQASAWTRMQDVAGKLATLLPVIVHMGNLVRVSRTLGNGKSCVDFRVVDPTATSSPKPAC